MIFEKWHGLGNDFVFVDGRKEPAAANAETAKAVCDRHFGVGADGLVILTPLENGEVEMRIFNSDGSECEMCGNATRCAAKFIRAHHLVDGNEFCLRTKAGLIRPRLEADGRVRVDMGEPRQLEAYSSVRGRKGNVVSMGNPHFVIYVDDLASVDLPNEGPQLECDPVFPHKSNIEFVQILAPNRVRMRVWERGCGITNACGTGSCASVVAGAHNSLIDRKCTVVLDGGELEIEWSAADNHIYMTGPAAHAFTGETKEGIAHV